MPLHQSDKILYAPQMLLPAKGGTIFLATCPNHRVSNHLIQKAARGLRGTSTSEAWVMLQRSAEGPKELACWKVLVACLRSLIWVCLHMGYTPQLQSEYDFRASGVPHCQTNSYDLICTVAWSTAFRVFTYHFFWFWCCSCVLFSRPITNCDPE